MTVKNIESLEQSYELNQFQQYFVKTKELKKTLEQVKFPILILDMEFFNRSHNFSQLKATNCDLTGSDSFVYSINFAIYPNLRKLLANNSKVCIKNHVLKRTWGQPNYSFQKSYQNLVEGFTQELIKSKVKTIVVAGASNDRQIINSWLKFKEKDVIFWDIYPTLEQTMAFTNLDSKGQTFWNPRHLKRGFKGLNTIALPSLKKFFNYMVDEFPNFNHNDDFDIYHLSHEILEFFCRDSLDLKQYQSGVRSLRVANKHCFNDVYKIITLIKFWHHLVTNKSYTRFSDRKIKYE